MREEWVGKGKGVKRRGMRNGEGIGDKEDEEVEMKEKGSVGGSGRNGKGNLGVGNMGIKWGGGT